VITSAQPAATVPAGWVAFKSPDGYSVAFPQQPKASKQPIPGSGDVTINACAVLDKKIALLSMAIPVSPAELANSSSDAGFR
jgi:hypothetical protein